jgi:DNA-binding LytR/AlgR family response regulator
MRKRKLEKLLPKEKICRVHKSYMVNLSMIETLERECIRIGKKHIPISDTYKNQVYAQLGI